jgi:hypothetical protein
MEEKSKEVAIPASGSSEPRTNRKSQGGGTSASQTPKLSAQARPRGLGGQPARRKGPKTQNPKKVLNELKDQVKNAEAKDPLAAKKAELELILLDIKLAKAELERLRANESYDAYADSTDHIYESNAKKQELEQLDLDIKKTQVEGNLKRATTDNKIKNAEMDIELLTVQSKLAVARILDDTNTTAAVMKAEMEFEALKEKHRASIEPVLPDGCDDYLTVDQDTLFADQFDLLEEGVKTHGYILPSIVSDRTYCINGVVNASGVLNSRSGWRGSVLGSDFNPVDFDGWEQSSILLSEMKKNSSGAWNSFFSDENFQFVFQLLSGVASGLAGISCATHGTLKGIKNVGLVAGAISAVSFYSAIHSILDRSLEKVELRAFVSNTFAADDNRPKADRVLEEFGGDRITKLRPFFYIRLTGGQELISFDPHLFGLDHWSMSKDHAGYIRTDADHRFRPLYVSSVLMNEVLSRRTITVSEFDKRRAVERMSKQLENCHYVGEQLDLLVETGESVYKNTLMVASALVTRSPEVRPAAF